MSTYSSSSPRLRPHTLLAIEDHKHHKHSKHHPNTPHKHSSKPTSSPISSTTTTSHPTTPTTSLDSPTTTTTTTTTTTIANSKKARIYLKKSVPLYQPPIPTLPKRNKQSSSSTAVCKDAMYIPTTMKIFTPHNYDPPSISHLNPYTPITDTYPSSSGPTTSSILQYENTLVTKPAYDHDTDWLRVADGLYESIVASKLALKQRLKDEFYGTKYSTKTKKNHGEKRGVGVDNLAKSNIRERASGHNSDLSPRPPSAPKPSSTSANATTARYQRRTLSHTTATSMSINATNGTHIDPLPLTDSVVEAPVPATTTNTTADDLDLMNLIDTGTQAYEPTTTSDMNTHTLAPSPSSSSDTATVVGRHNHQPSMPLTNRVAIDTNLLAWFCAHPRRHTLSSAPATLHQPAVLIARRRIKQQYLTLGSVPGTLPATHRSTRVADND